MYTVTSFDGSHLEDAELGRIMAEYVAVERLRAIRRLLVVPCGLLALVTALVGLGLHGLTMIASWCGISACVAPAASTWMLEARRNARLGRLLAAVPDGTTEVVSPTRTDGGKP